MSSTRREFLEKTGTGVTATVASAAWLWASESRAEEKTKSDGPLPVAVIGPGGMGSHHTQLLASNTAVRVAYVCDVDEQRAARAAEMVTKGSGKTPQVVKDMRRIFDDKE